MPAIRTIDDSLSRINRDIISLLGGVDRKVYDHEAAPFNFMGKAVRSRFTLLLGGALGLDAGRAEKLSAAAELVHTASLLHDDCVDQAALRRGLLTLNERLGVNTAILVGDLVVAMAFEYAARISPELSGSLVETVRSMAEGALLEENSRHRRVSAAEAERMIGLKTGSLFRWCALAACRLVDRPELFEACGDIGTAAGLAFQLTDDVLDLESASAETGKDALKDLLDGRMTMPVILALEDPALRPELEGPLLEMRNSAARDLAPALKMAGLLKERGYTSKVRELALAKAQGLKAALDRLPDRAAALDLKAFICAMASRTR